MFDSIRETIDYAVENKMSFADIMIQEEMELSGKTRDEVRETMKLLMFSLAIFISLK